MSTAVLCSLRRRGHKTTLRCVSRPGRADGHDRRPLSGRWGGGKRGSYRGGAEDPAFFPGKAANLARLIASRMGCRPDAGPTVEQVLGLPAYGARRRGA